MSKNNFEETMNRLNQYYDKIPQQSNSADIMASIKKKKKRNWNWARSYQKWQVAALVLFMLGIGYVLGASQLTSNNESAMPSESSADEGPMESMSVVMEEEPDESEEETNEMTFMESSTDDEETKTITIVDEEGLEDEKTVTKLVNDELSFTTFYDAEFEVEHINHEQSTVVQIFANYGQGKIEPVLFEVVKFNEEMSYEEAVSSYQADMVDAGYAETVANGYLESLGVPGQGVEEFAFYKDGVYAHVVPVEHQDGYYFLRTNSFSPERTDLIEYSEGFVRELRVIFNEFTWLY
ncbi:hypothetical protein JCM9140_4696 [Halalkalibacter wakoensis JCM 9140]|uniref:Uncharacterized protein n=1 Tax=Halalkalibacter wakoensis JCM 9140 TaxID=1236970 RepID=W4QAR9_9BACI|nr:hypothetical protein [Halalkalibacter wakoensis]GAE28459.1 hypothetical protein JCM9140_4696 [Halalkalibacter wakoensis JCM 9140]